MSKDLLAGVNELLKKTDILDSDVGVLTSLTDSARQTFIDSAIQAINEVMDELYVISRTTKPKQLKESTITLTTGERDYSLHSQLVTLRTEFGLIDEANNQVITLLDEDGYRRLITADLEQDDTGLPHWAAINPVDGRLFMDRAPTSLENGNVYKYRFDRDTVLDEATDEFPFSDTVFRAIIPAAAQLWKLNHQQEFAGELFNRSMARAARLLRKIPARTSWSAPRSGPNVTDPLNDATISR